MRSQLYCKARNDTSAKQSCRKGSYYSVVSLVWLGFVADFALQDVALDFRCFENDVCTLLIFCGGNAGIDTRVPPCFSSSFSVFCSELAQGAAYEISYFSRSCSRLLRWSISFLAMLPSASCNFTYSRMFLH